MCHSRISLPLESLFSLCYRAPPLSLKNHGCSAFSATPLPGRCYFDCHSAWSDSLSVSYHLQWAKKTFGGQQRISGGHTEGACGLKVCRGCYRAKMKHLTRDQAFSKKKKNRFLKTLGEKRMPLICLKHAWRSVNSCSCIYPTQHILVSRKDI